MDEDDIFPVLCPKKTYAKQFIKVKRTTSESDNGKNTSRRAGKTYDPGVPLTTKVAVEYLLSGKLKTSVCRYCLKVTVGLSELDQIMQVAGTGVMYKVTIREIIACFYPFKARQEESFPEKICQRCIDRAINAYLFTQQCEQAERALQNCFDDMSEKFNKLDPLDRKKKRGRQKLHPNTNILYAEHHNVMDYAEPLRNIINLQTESLTNEPAWNEFECKKCWQVLPDLETLLNHEQIHSKYMWYHCRLCGKSFVKINQLKKHFNHVHVKGKGVPDEVDKTFKCKECGNVTENYVQHLQHIEKHKFKTIMKHLVEKKTDQLCLVCLKKSTDLVELDKMVCIHGSCPELVGDTSLYTVLASTLPDQKSYKYRELHVPRKANIMTITKRKRKYQEIQNVPHKSPKIQFDLSLPKLITKDKFKTDDFYYYAFCEPQTEDIFIRTIENNLVTKSPRIVEITDEETMDCNLDDQMPINGEMRVIENSSTESIIMGTKKQDDVIRNDNPEIDMLIDDNETTYVTEHNNVINENEVKDGTQIVSKLNNKKPDKNYYPSGEIVMDDKEIIIGNSNVNDKKLNVKEPTDVVGNPDDIIHIDEKYPTDLIEENNIEAEVNKSSFKVYNPSMFRFSYPIIIEFDDNNTNYHNTKLDTDKASTIFNISNPDNTGKTIDDELHYIKSIEERDFPEDDELPIKGKTALSWILTKTSDSKKLFENNEETDYISNAIAEPEVKGDCKFCWLFKHLNKCEYCKKVIDTGVKIIEKDNKAIEKNTVIDDETNNNIEKQANNAIFPNEDVEIQPKSMKSDKNDKESKIEQKWKCNVCLTNNNNDRASCQCCESNKCMENGNCKVTFGLNKTFINSSSTHENENKIKKEVGTSIEETKSFIDIDEATMNTKMGTIQENTETMDNIRDIHSMDIEIDTVTDTINEEMDVEEEPFIPTVQTIDLVPPSAAKVAQYVRTNNPVPILAAEIAPYVGTNIQFNIGSNFIQNEKGPRKFKRAVRKIAKAFHK